MVLTACIYSLKLLLKFNFPTFISAHPITLRRPTHEPRITRGGCAIANKPFSYEHLEPPRRSPGPSLSVVMLRSPLNSRLLPAILVALITITILFKSISPSGSLLSHGDTCDVNGQCDVSSEGLKPPSRSELQTLNKQIKELKEDIDKLKTKPVPKVLTPEEKEREERRNECNENVIRNIDYQHVSLFSLYFWYS